MNAIRGISMTKIISGMVEQMLVRQALGLAIQNYGSTIPVL